MSAQERVRFEFGAMGTDFEFQAVGPVRERTQVLTVFHEAKNLVKEIEASLSRFQAGSCVSRWNRSSGEFVPVGGHMRSVLRLAGDLYRATGRRFNPFGRGSPDGIEVLDDQARRIDPVCSLDFGAIGKGYALDAVQAALLREGVENFLIQCGGSSILFRGSDLNENPWRLGWRLDEEDARESRGAVFFRKSGAARGVGISGESEKGAHIQGVTQGHSISSAWADHPSAAVADAFSTALFIAASESSDDPFLVEDSVFQERKIAKATLFADRTLITSPSFLEWSRESLYG